MRLQCCVRACHRRARYVVSGTGTYTQYISSLGWLVNNTGFRVWFHQNTNGSGWADCFDHGNAFELTGRDQNPGNIQITTNSTECSPSSGTKLCSIDAEMAFTTNFTTDGCYYSPVTYTSIPTPFYYLTNGSGYRVWLHENKNSSGWADCFSNNNGYLLYTTRDEIPGNLQVNTTRTPC